MNTTLYYGIRIGSDSTILNGLIINNSISKNIVQKYKPGYEVIEIGLLTSLNTILLYNLYTNSDTIVSVFNKTVRNLRLK